MGDSGLEILHGGVGGDVELGARTSKHILLLAFDPLVSLTLSLSHLFVQSIILHSYHILLVLPCIFYIVHPYMLGLLVCVPHLYLTTRASHSTSTHSRGIKRS